LPCRVLGCAPTRRRTSRGSHALCCMARRDEHVVGACGELTASPDLAPPLSGRPRLGHRTIRALRLALWSMHGLAPRSAAGDGDGHAHHLLARISSARRCGRTIVDGGWYRVRVMRPPGACMGLAGVQRGSRESIGAGDGFGERRDGSARMGVREAVCGRQRVCGVVTGCRAEASRRELGPRCHRNVL